MKILVLSDTHGNIERIMQLCKRYQDIEFIIHLGDNNSDTIIPSNEYPTRNFITVRGNTDPSGVHPEERILEFNNIKILITHGHRYGVKHSMSAILHHAKQAKVDIVLFGHTHLPLCQLTEGIWLCNPGSLNLPKSGDLPSYGILTLYQQPMDNNYDFAIFKYY